jgi:hypothetical protein
MKFTAVSWIYNEEENVGHPITIDRCKQRDGSHKYAVRQAGSCLNKSGDWEYEPINSHRDDEFFGRCRFGTFDEAEAAIERKWQLDPRR